MAFLQSHRQTHSMLYPSLPISAGQTFPRLQQPQHAASMFLLGRSNVLVRVAALHQMKKLLKVRSQELQKPPPTAHATK